MLYCFENCCLDLARGRLSVAEREVSLRPKSFDVLRYLVENAGRLIPKEEIIAAVWSNIVVTDESLARCVSDIRVAIGDRGQTIVKVVPRRGYRFTADVAALKLRQASGEHASGPDRPSIAILAFANMSGDPSQEYLSDGITEDVITELSRFRELLVIARNSSFKYKGRFVDVREIGQELGVRYLLEGSVRRVTDRVSITAQLVDAASGAHLWAERYDRELTDALAVQHEVARTVAVILAAHVGSAEAERVRTKPPATWEAHDYYMRSLAVLTSFMSSFRMADLVEARHLAERSVSLDPGYARPYAILAITCICDWGAFDSRSPNTLDPSVLDKARALARNGVRLDGRIPELRAVHAAALSWMQRHDEALAEFDKAIALNPNYSDWRHMLVLFHASEHARALEVGRAYFRLDPFAPAAARAWLGAVHYMLGRYAEAVPHLQEAVSRIPNARFGRMWLAATYAQIGKVTLARAEAAEALQIDPGYTIEGTTKLFFGFRLSADTAHLCDGLRKAGVPER